MRVAGLRAAFFSLLVGVLLFKAPLWGEVYAPLELTDTFYPWRHFAVQRDVSRILPEEGFSMRDDLLVAIPQDAFIHDALREGRMPLWNPLVMCGVPFAAYYRTVWYPPRALLLWAFDPITGSLLSVFLHLVAAGVFMAWFLDRLGLRREAATFGGLVWMLSGYATAWVEIYYVPIACALLPALLASLDGLASRRDGRWVAASSMAMGLLFVGCHWQFAFYGAAFASLWYLWRVRLEEGWGRWLFLPLVWVCAIGVGAVQIVPTLQLASLAGRPPLPSLEVVNEKCRLLPEQLLTLLLPELFGSPPSGFFYTRVVSGLQSFNELALYVGLAPLLLVFGAPRCRVRAWSFFAASAVAALLLASGSPLYTLAWKVVAPMRFFTPVRILWIFAFCMAVLAACGLQRALDAGRLPGGDASGVALLIIIALTEGVAFSFLAPGGAGFDDLFMRYIRWGAFQMPRYASAEPYARAVVARMADHYQSGNLPFLAPLLLMMALIVVGALFERRRVGRACFVAVLFVLTAADLIGFGLRANPTAPRTALYPPTPATRRLQQISPAMRAGGLGLMPPPEVFSAYGITDVGGYESLAPGNVRRLFTEINAGADAYILGCFHDGGRFNHGIADLLGMRIIYANVGEKLPVWTRPLALPDLAVGENAQALPRLFVVAQAQVLDGDAAVIARLTTPTFNPRDAVLLSAPPRRLPEGAEQGGESTIRYARPRPERVEADVRLARASWVVFTESSYPGWRAFIDGEEAPIETAYTAFQAVAMPSGAHQLALVFDPPVQRWGAVISVVTVLALLGGALRRSDPCLESGETVGTTAIHGK